VERQRNEDAVIGQVEQLVRCAIHWPPTIRLRYLGRP
jgi:hypothetical protein